MYSFLFCFKRGSYYVLRAVPKLILQTKVALNSQRCACLSLPRARIKVVSHHHPGYKSGFFPKTLNKCLDQNSKYSLKPVRTPETPLHFILQIPGQGWAGVCRGKTLSQRSILQHNHDPPEQACHTEQTPGTFYHLHDALKVPGNLSSNYFSHYSAISGAQENATLNSPGEQVRIGELRSQYFGTHVICQRQFLQLCWISVYRKNLSFLGNSVPIPLRLTAPPLYSGHPDERDCRELYGYCGSYHTPRLPGNARTAAHYQTNTARSRRSITGFRGSN